MPEPDAQTKLYHLEKQNEEIKASLDKINNALYGNEDNGLKTEVKLIASQMETLSRALNTILGPDGIVHRLSVLENSVADHHKSVEELQKRRTASWQWIVSIVTAVGAALLAWFK